MDATWGQKVESLAQGHQHNFQERRDAINSSEKECVECYNQVISVTFKEVAEKWKSMGEVFGAEAKQAEKVGGRSTLTFKYNGNNVLQIAVKVEQSAFGAMFSGTTADFRPVEPPAPIRFAGAQEIRASVINQDALMELITGRLEAALEKHLPVR